MANLQDLLIYVLKGISDIVVKGKLEVTKIAQVNHELTNSLFMTITNANFDPEAIEKQIRKMLDLRGELLNQIKVGNLHDSATFKVNTKEEMIEKSRSVGVLSIQPEDVRSLKEMIKYGLKGMAAYAEHASNLGKEDPQIYSFIYEALAKSLDETISVEELVKLTLKTGEYGVKVMALLDEANTSKYGNPKITKVNIGVRTNPAILISGHDLADLHQLLEQTKGTGVDVYTHGEMLPAHYYPFFSKYDNLVGNYGNAWWKQIEEFEQFHGPILFTTNCIVPPRSDEVKGRIFTTGSVGYPGCEHIEADTNGKKDFSKIIKLAKSLPPPAQLESGSIIGGFAHNQVIELA
ncbi:MAG TPA: hydroxylamine reductase, partial [Exilispira sp.]|nr:hydroxylamine reductase [Exilispira sp.]